MFSRNQICVLGMGVLGMMLAGCRGVAQQNTSQSAVVWQEGEATIQVRDGLAKIADLDKKPASGGAVLYGQALSPQGASASWKVALPQSIAQAQISFRYGRLHWRADMKPAPFLLRLTGPGGEVSREITFGPTRGWGVKPSDYDVLTLQTGAMAAGEWTVSLTSLAAVNDLSVDGFFIAPANLAITASEFNEASRILIDSNGYVGISAPPFVRQDEAASLKVLRRSFAGALDQGAVTATLKKVGADASVKVDVQSRATTQPVGVMPLRLPGGLPDGDYELTVTDSSRSAPLTLPITLAGTMINTLEGRIQQLQGFAKSVETAGDPAMAALTPTLTHLIQFIQNNQRGLVDVTASPGVGDNVRREGLADQEGAAPAAPSLVRLRLALDQAEMLMKDAADKRSPFASRTGEFRMAYTSAVDGRLAVYRLYIPSSYHASKQMPAVLFLHGGGGDENYWPELSEGLMLKILEERGYIGIMPHWNRRSFGEHWMQDQVQLLDEVSRTWTKIDPDRVYVTGISMGGDGTFRLAVAHPERFAAFCCVSGPGVPDLAPELKPLPVMIIHGGSDTVSPPDRAVQMNELLKSLGHKVEFHMFPMHGHNYHARTYLELTLDFFAKHRRKPVPAGEGK